MTGKGRFPTAELLVLCTSPLARRLFGDSAALRRERLGVLRGSARDCDLGILLNFCREESNGRDGQI